MWCGETEAVEVCETRAARRGGREPVCPEGVRAARCHAASAGASAAGRRVRPERGGGEPRARSSGCGGARQIGFSCRSVLTGGEGEMAGVIAGFSLAQRERAEGEGGADRRGASR